jgi:hypothetical protein
MFAVEILINVNSLSHIYKINDDHVDRDCNTIYTIDPFLGEDMHITGVHSYAFVVRLDLHTVFWQTIH